MFQIHTSPARGAASALTVLAAIGASGMASEATAAPVNVETSMAARAKNSSYAYLASNWENWLSLSNWSNVGVKEGITSRGFVTWDSTALFGNGSITEAKFKIQKNNNSSSYGIPAGAHVEFALITDAWDSLTPKAGDPDGPDVQDATALLLEAPADGYYEADITPLLQLWQANPGSYYGIRLYSPDSGGGVVDQNNTEAGRAGITGDLLLTTVPLPEPGSLILAVAGVLPLRRSRR